MITEIVSASAGAMVTAAITLFGDEIKSIVLRISGKRRQNANLLGKWNCIWKVEGEEKEIKDHVEISSARPERILAVGKNPESGNYVISGRLSPSHLVTLTYRGDDKKSLLGGVIILELNLTRDIMEGYWWEYDNHRKFIGGSTVWEKA